MELKVINRGRQGEIVGECLYWGEIPHKIAQAQRDYDLEQFKEYDGKQLMEIAYLEQRIEDLHNQIKNMVEITPEEARIILACMNLTVAYKPILAKLKPIAEKE